MNLKKYIKIKQDAQEIQLTEEEQELYNSLLKRVELNAEKTVAVKRHINLWKILAPLASVLGVIAITLTCVFVMKTTDELLYKDEFIKSDSTSFIEMQTNVKFFDLSGIETNIERVNISYDSRSNDKLFYSIFADVEFTTIELVVVINSKYNYEFDIKGNTVSKQLTDYTVIYNSESTRGKPQINYKGWIKVKTETVYFDYVQSPALGDEAFFESIQQIIQVKK